MHVSYKLSVFASRAIPITYFSSCKIKLCKTQYVLLLWCSIFSSSVKASSAPPQVESMVKIGAAIHAIEKEGQLRFLTENGRFMIEGRLYDLWQKTYLTSFNTIKQAVNHIDLKALDFDLSALSPLKLGQGEEQVTMFIDPNCPYCHQLLIQAAKLTENYTFWIIPVPVLGESSLAMIKQLSCETDPKKALTLLINNQLTDKNTVVACDLTQHLGTIQKRMITAQIFGIQSVPFLISPDGRTQQGMPTSLFNWLKEE